MNISFKANLIPSFSFRARKEWKWLVEINGEDFRMSTFGPDAPTLDAVLIENGLAGFDLGDIEPFTEWCRRLGYSNDSRNARELFDYCAALTIANLRESPLYSEDDEERFAVHWKKMRES